MKRIILLIFISTLAFTLYANEYNVENWPAVQIKPEYRQIVKDKIIEYFKKNNSYNNNLQNYSAFGEYMNWGSLKYNNSDTMQIDVSGLPKNKYGQDYYYNPVTVSQYALSMYSRYIKGENTFSNFITAADKLIDLQKENGALPYNFTYSHPLQELEYGWVSSMAQGHALSVFARAYKATNDKRYLEAGNKAFKFLITPVSEGGVMDTLDGIDPTLSEYIFFQEYVTTPKSYTLNGYIFSIFGIYDWSQLNIENSELAYNYFSKSIKTLTKILPYYDIGGITTYDLEHITTDKQPLVIPFYHAVHIYQLHALFSMTEDSSFKKYENIFSGYVNSAPTMIKDVSIDKGSPQSINNTITFTVSALGEKTKYYQFWVKDGEQWQIVQEYSTKKEYSWTPTEAKDYFIGVYLKDIDSKELYDDQVNFKYVITK